MYAEAINLTFNLLMQDISDQLYSRMRTHVRIRFNLSWTKLIQKFSYFLIFITSLGTFDLKI